MGLLIGVIAKNDEQAIGLSLVPMFVLSGLGGAWVPLEITGELFQAIGHLSPVAWAMDGFKNISIRGLGFESALIPASALSYVVGTLGAKYFLGEQISAARWAGVLLVCAGVALVAAG